VYAKIQKKNQITSQELFQFIAISFALDAPRRAVLTGYTQVSF
jgi:hypothetical protein